MTTWILIVMAFQSMQFGPFHDEALCNSVKQTLIAAGAGPISDANARCVATGLPGPGISRTCINNNGTQWCTSSGDAVAAPPTTP